MPLSLRVSVGALPVNMAFSLKFTVIVICLPTPQSPGSGAAITEEMVSGEGSVLTKLKKNGSIDAEIALPLVLVRLKLLVPGVPLKSRRKLTLLNRALVPLSALDAQNVP